jgi:hypothetical protein
MSWVEGVLQRYNLWEKYKQQRVLLFWEEAVGRQIAQVSRPERFSDGTLWISVSSSTVAQELSFFEARYIERINDLFGEQVLRRIRFFPGQFGKVAPRKRATLSAADHEEARRLFSTLSDPELRKAFEQLYLTLRSREANLLLAGAKRCPRCGAVFSGRQDTCPGCRFEGD